MNIDSMRSETVFLLAHDNGMEAAFLQDVPLGQFEDEFVRGVFIEQQQHLGDDLIFTLVAAALCLHVTVVVVADQV